MNVSPFSYVYVTENGEEALIYYNKFKKRIRGSFELNDGKSFAFHKCIVNCKNIRKQKIKKLFRAKVNTCSIDKYVFYQFDQNYLRSKGKKNYVIPIDEDRTKRFPHLVPEKIEKEYSIMFYYTKEFAASNEYDTIEIGEYFEELVQKTNLGYQNRNISIRARMHCFELATIERDIAIDRLTVLAEGVSDKFLKSKILDQLKKVKEMRGIQKLSFKENVFDNMSVILDKFKDIRGTPKKLRNLADVAVLGKPSKKGGGSHR